MRYFGIPDSNLQLLIILRIFQWIGCKRTQSRIVCAVILHLQRYEENITVEYPNFDSNYATSFVGKCFVIPALRKSYLWMGRWNVFARIALQAKRVCLRIPAWCTERRDQWELVTNHGFCRRWIGSWRARLSLWEADQLSRFQLSQECRRQLELQGEAVHGIGFRSQHMDD